MENEWTLSAAEVAKKWQTDLARGLSLKEALARGVIHGANRLCKKRGPSFWHLIWAQFSSAMVWLLIGAALVAFFLGDVLDAYVIISIVILNGILGFFQEYRAERSLEALQKIQVSFAKVIREGELQTISLHELVPGDLVFIESGDQIPADGRIVSHVKLKVNESMLTGESVPVSKVDRALATDTLPIADQKNMVFMGTMVTEGRGYFLVTSTGKSSQMGKIAAELSGAEKMATPLQEQLGVLGRKLVYICLAVIAVVFILGVVRGNPLFEMLLTALSLAVAAIPEGLPIAVTIALSAGIAKMVKKQGLIRRLSSVETLGCTDVICTDKTGTLTENAMVVRHVCLGGDVVIDVTGEGYAPLGDLFISGEKLKAPYTVALQRTFAIAMLCNRANIFKKEGAWFVSGDPTEGALIALASKGGMLREPLEHAFDPVEEIPFDSDRKMMSVIGSEEGFALLLAKGAPHVILEKSTHILKGDVVEPLTLEERSLIEQRCQTWASQGYRTLALAYQKGTLDRGIEKELVFVSLLAIADPPREGVKEAIAKCKKAGIQTVMITGDHKGTALAIGREVSLIGEGSLAFEGIEIDQMSDEELDQKLPFVSVFARITAHHKLRIIRRFQALGKVTAMTGDGVNDAPAVHAADIGISMGIAGSDVTKESSDLILLDDKFTSIVDAIEQGRGIYDNILKFLSYLLTSNIAEILVIFVAILADFRDMQGNPFMILLPTQLLWINLITDGFPVMCLALDPPSSHVMEQKPKGRFGQGGLLNKETLWFIAVMSLAASIGVLLAGLYGVVRTSVALGQTMAFTTLVVVELIKALLVRFQYQSSFLSNPSLLYAIGGSLLLHIAVVYFPFAQKIFGTTALHLADWILIGGITAFVMLVNFIAIRIQQIWKNKQFPHQ